MVSGVAKRLSAEHTVPIGLDGVNLLVDIMKYVVVAHLKECDDCKTLLKI